MSKTIKEKKTQIDVQKLCQDNQLEILNLDHINKWYPILRPAINRTGFELLNHFYSKSITNIIGWGSTESNYMDRISKEELAQILEKIFLKHPPLVICSNGVNERNRTIILEQANKNHVPVVFSDTQLSLLTTTIGIYIAQYFAPEEFVHGSLVVINGIGVLIIGDSGVGKSEAVLNLIQRGHLFVSDDAVYIQRIGNEFIGYSPAEIKNILEARGLGLLDIRNIYGDRSMQAKTKIDLVVSLIRSEANDFDRLGNEKNYFFILGGKIDKVNIPVRLGRNVASLIEAAANLFVSKQNGCDALVTVQKRFNER